MGRKPPQPHAAPTLEDYIKRKLIRGIVITSACAALLGVLVLVVYFRWGGASSTLRAGLYLGLAVFLFVGGLLLGGWYIVHTLTPPLTALGHLERAIRESAQGETAQHVSDQLSTEDHYGSLFYDYNLLVERLKEKDILRLEFLGFVLHELRSPLAAILGYASILTDTSHPPTPAEMDRYVHIMFTQAQRMSDLADDVVTAAQAQFDRLDIVATTIRIDSFLAEVVDEFAQQSRRQIIFSSGPGPWRVVGDALRLRQVFVNLLENAVKFSPAETPVSVTLRRSEAGGLVEVAVADQGIGLAADDIPKLFRPFGRIKNMQTRGIAGSGLGLYIVSHIIQRHDGSVTVASQPGEGSVFTVSLPLESKEQA